MIEHVLDGELEQILDYAIQLRLVYDVTGLEPEDVHDLEIQENGKTVEGTVWMLDDANAVQEQSFMQPKKQAA